MTPNSEEEKERRIKLYEDALKKYEKWEKVGIKHFVSALRKQNREDFQGAIKYYSKAIETSFSPSLLLIDRGRCKTKIGDYEGAKNDILKAIELDPANGDGYDARLEMMIFQGGNTKEILEIYKKCLELSELNASLGFCKDKTPLLDKELNIWTKTINDIKKYTQQISINKEIGNSYYQRGILKQKLFNFKEVIPYLFDSLNKQVIEDFTKTIELNFRSEDSYFQRGIAKSLWAQNEEEKIEEGECQESIKKYKEAIKDFTKAIELNPKNDKYFYKRGECQESLKKDKMAIKDFSKAIELNPKNDKYFYKRGVFQESLEKDKKAIKDFSRAIELNPKCIKYFYKRGEFLLSLKKYEEAIEDFSVVIEYIGCKGNFWEALEDKEFDADCLGGAYFDRGYAKIFLKDYEGAIEDFLTYKKYEISDEMKKATYKNIKFCKTKLFEIDDILYMQ